MDAGATSSLKVKHNFSPSLMCADISNLGAEIKALEKAGVDSFHIDIMDGEFVPNFALSWLDVAFVRGLTSLPLEVHLMVMKARIHFPYALKFGVNTIYIHFESGNTEENLKIIKDRGVQAGLAISPETSLQKAARLFKNINKLLVMRVNPGFASANSIEAVEDKIGELLDMKPAFEIVLDGSVGREIISKWGRKRNMGFVLGTRCGLFGKNRAGRAYKDIIEMLRLQ